MKEFTAAEPMLVRTAAAVVMPRPVLRPPENPVPAVNSTYSFPLLRDVVERTPLAVVVLLLAVRLPLERVILADLSDGFQVDDVPAHATLGNAAVGTANAGVLGDRISTIYSVQLAM